MEYMEYGRSFFIIIPKFSQKLWFLSGHDVRTNLHKRTTDPQSPLQWECWYTSARWWVSPLGRVGYWFSVIVFAY